MKKRKLIPDPVLMIISVVVITGFQLYWLRNNYNDAKHNLEVQANVAFQETVRGQHIKTLKLAYNIQPDHPREKMLFLDKYAKPVNGQIDSREDEILATVSALQSKIADSLHEKRVTITADSDTVSHDSTKIFFSGIFRSTDTTGKAIKLVFNLDSLKDTLELPKLIKAYAETLEQQNISVPFSIVKLPKVVQGDEAMSFATVGIAHPVTYQLQLGNTFPFLMKKIAWPVLFSVFLVGITVISFLILYKNLLRQQRLAVIKNEFISNITHELKTPIATVGVAIEALKNFNALHDEQKTKEYLDISANELQRLSLLVDKVLKLSMFEKKELELKPEKVNVKDLVQEVIKSMRLQIEKYPAAVFLHSEGDTTLNGDRMHLQSVIFNLLDNALKYSRGEPVIDIHLNERENKIQLSITDNGIGIAPEYLGKIFEKFFRVPMGDRHNAKGYGLGLSYVAQIAELHHGTLDVKSEPGEGTTFIITLPKTQA
ncbi:MAG TPA: HAMP domain-containing sensor histidine kinase [Chitinophagaceae bacterium]|nr:HAMP domain-containing sensor histidine kinase [Chitinophagaceae bacterium]